MLSAVAVGIWVRRKREVVAQPEAQGLVAYTFGQDGTRHPIGEVVVINGQKSKVGGEPGAKSVSVKGVSAWPAITPEELAIDQAALRVIRKGPLKAPLVTPELMSQILEAESNSTTANSSKAKRFTENLSDSMLELRLSIGLLMQNTPSSVGYDSQQLAADLEIVEQAVHQPTTLHLMLRYAFEDSKANADCSKPLKALLLKIKREIGH